MDHQQNQRTRNRVRQIATGINLYGQREAASPHTAGFSNEEREVIEEGLERTNGYWRDRNVSESPPRQESRSQSPQPAGDYPVENDEDSVPGDREGTDISSQERGSSETIEEKAQRRKADYAAAQAETKKIKEAYQESEKRVESLTEELNNLQAERRRHVRELDCSDETAADLMLQVNHLRKKLASAREKEENLRRELEESRAREEQLEKQLREAREQVHLQLQRLQPLPQNDQTQLELRTRRLEYQQSIHRAQLESEMQRRTERERRLETERHNLERDLRNAESEISRLRGGRRPYATTRNGELRFATYTAT